MALELILKEARGMSEDALTEVLHFMRYIKIESVKNSRVMSAVSTEGTRHKLRSAGIYRGKGTMADDFDAPLDDFKEYM